MAEVMYAVTDSRFRRMVVFGVLPGVFGTFQMLLIIRVFGDAESVFTQGIQFGGLPLA